MLLVVALEIRDLVEAAWKAYRANRTKRSRRRIALPAPRPRVPQSLAPTSQRA